jgi:hypothetical protein
MQGRILRHRNVDALRRLPNQKAETRLIPTLSHQLSQLRIAFEVVEKRQTFQATILVRVFDECHSVGVAEFAAGFWHFHRAIYKTEDAILYIVDTTIR